MHAGDVIQDNIYSPDHFSLATDSNKTPLFSVDPSSDGERLLRLHESLTARQYLRTSCKGSWNWGEALGSLQFYGQSWFDLFTDILCWICIREFWEPIQSRPDPRVLSHFCVLCVKKISKLQRKQGLRRVIHWWYRPSLLYVNHLMLVISYWHRSGTYFLERITWASIHKQSRLFHFAFSG